MAARWLVASNIIGHRTHVVPVRAIAAVIGGYGGSRPAGVIQLTQATLDDVQRGPNSKGAQARVLRREAMRNKI